jgi:hypothetical protein
MKRKEWESRKDERREGIEMQEIREQNKRDLPAGPLASARQCHGAAGLSPSRSCVGQPVPLSVFPGVCFVMDRGDEDSVSVHTHAN